jgi:hypothetical protein
VLSSISIANGPLIAQINSIEPDLPDQGTRLYDPGLIVVKQSRHPSLCCLLGHRAQITAITSIHPKYLGVGSELYCSPTVPLMSVPRPSSFSVILD